MIGKEFTTKETDWVVALAGNPNTGKSTVFNGLTGLNQHTGNWPGKTVLKAEGRYTHAGFNYLLIDLPGTYSLFANSPEEQITRDFICFEQPDVTVVVADATCLERNLNLVLQVLEITHKAVVCVNLLDEATRKGILVDLEVLSEELGVPVVGAVAREGIGLPELKETVALVAQGVICPRPRRILYGEEVEKAVEELLPRLNTETYPNLNKRWLALRLLEGDPSVFEYLKTPAVAGDTLLKLVWAEG